jgi:hypothetical protein
MVFGGKLFFFLSPLAFLPPPLLATTSYSYFMSELLVSTRCLCCYLQILEPGGLQLLKLGFVGSSSYPLDLVERIILMLMNYEVKAF